MIKIVAGDDSYRIGEIIKFKELGKPRNNYLIVNEDRSAGPFSTEYTMLPLNISKYWPIKQIQLWALRKAFKKI